MHALRVLRRARTRRPRPPIGERRVAAHRFVAPPSRSPARTRPSAAAHTSIRYATLAVPPNKQNSNTTYYSIAQNSTVMQLSARLWIDVFILVHLCRGHAKCTKPQTGNRVILRSPVHDSCLVPPRPLRCSPRRWLGTIRRWKPRPRAAPTLVQHVRTSPRRSAWKRPCCCAKMVTGLGRVIALDRLRRPPSSLLLRSSCPGR